MSAPPRLNFVAPQTEPQLPPPHFSGSILQCLAHLRSPLVGPGPGASKACVRVQGGKKCGEEYIRPVTLDCTAPKTWSTLIPTNHEPLVLSLTSSRALTQLYSALRQALSIARKGNHGSLSKIQNFGPSSFFGTNCWSSRLSFIRFTSPGHLSNVMIGNVVAVAMTSCAWCQRIFGG